MSGAGARKLQRAKWVQNVMRRELEAVCGEAADDVLSVALMLAAQSSVPTDTDQLRSFIFGELVQTLARLEGTLIAQTAADTLAGLLLDRTGVHRLTDAPQWSLTQARTASGHQLASSQEEARLTARPRQSHTKAIVSGLGVDLDSLFADIQIEADRNRQGASEQVAQHPNPHPVLLLSEFPEPAEELQEVLATRAEIYHHPSLDFFESDLQILLPRQPVLVLDARGRYAAFSARFIQRAAPDAAVLLWGHPNSGLELPGKRMVRCLGNSSAAELAMLIDVFLPKFKHKRAL